MISNQSCYAPCTRCILLPYLILFWFLLQEAGVIGTVTATTESIRCNQRLNGTVRFSYTWRPTFSTPSDEERFPGFQPILCVLHTESFTLFADAQWLSKGAREFVDSGEPQKLWKELNVSNAVAKPSFFSGEVVESPGESSVKFSYTPGFNLLSCIAPIWPSPDFFVGVSRVVLCEDDVFLKTIYNSLLIGWDGGFDDQEQWMGSPIPVTPRQIVPLKGKVDSFGEATVRGPESVVDDSDETDIVGADRPVCFPAHAEVLLQSGRRIQIQNLQYGQHIASSNASEYSPVYFFSHRDRNATSLFVKLYYALPLRNGTRQSFVLASSGHYIYTVPRKAAPLNVSGSQTFQFGTITLVPADKVHVGDFLVTENDTIVSVTGIGRAKGLGLYNPHTLDGNLIVDGIRVSAFTTAVSPQAANALLFPLRVAFLSGIFAPLVHLANWWVALSEHTNYHAQLLTAISTLSSSTKSVYQWH